MKKEVSQLGLKLCAKLVYSGEGYLDHQGVSQVRASILHGVKEARWISAFILGGSRFGKTHLSIRLVSDLTNDGFDVRLINSNEINEVSVRSNISSKTVFLVDEFEKYSPVETSGSFVSFYEDIKNKNGKVILFSSIVPSDLPFDDHILSRVKASARFEITHPGEKDIEMLLNRLSLQRGVRLKGRKLHYATLRVRKDIASLEVFVERIKEISQRSGEKIKFQTLSAAT